MKKISVIACTAVFSLLLFVQSCKKEAGPTGPQGPAGPALSGRLFGFVDLLDQYGDKIISHNDSILVTLDGTGKTTYTDANGKYYFDGLTTGVYSTTFTKTGFGTMRLLSEQFTGGGDVDRDTKMSIIPSFSVTGVTVTVDTAYVTLVGNFSNTDTRLRYGVVFLGATSAVSANPANYLLVYNKQATNGNPNGFTLKVPLTDLQNAGFASGSTVYFSAYGASSSFASSSTYEDFVTGRSYINALSASASTASVILP